MRDDPPETDLPFDVVELAPCPGGFDVEGEQPPLTEVPFRRTGWLPHESTKLRVLFFEDASVEQIAEALNRSVAAISQKLLSLGLRRSSKRCWTELDDEVVAQEFGKISNSDIATMLGRTSSAVQQRASMLGLTSGNAPPWSDWEMAQLRAGYEQGIPVPQLSVLIGRTPSSVTSKAANLGLRHINDPDDWSPEERVECLRLAETGMLYSKIAMELAKAGFPQRTKAAIDNFLFKAGYRRGWGRPWSTEEEDSLRAAYARGASIRQWGFLNARPPTQIRWKVEALGLQGTHVRPNGWRGEIWKPEEDELLKAEYGKTKTVDLAAKLGRGRLAVCQRAAALGLKHGYHRDFTEDEDRAFHIAWASREITFGDLAEVMGRDVAVIGRRAKHLGLEFSKRPHKPPRTPRKKRRQWTLSDILALGGKLSQ